MPTNLSQFRELIMNELTLSKPDPVFIEKLYLSAEAMLSFDEHDLAFTVSKEVSTSEPNWKRNLRNALQGLKDNGKLVNSSIGYWRLPSENTVNILDAEEAWTLIKANALIALNENITWESVKQGQKYTIDSIDDNKISIRRKSKGTIQFLYKRDVIRGINSLNTAGGILGRRSMIYTVAKEVAIVHFHPKLVWDETFEVLSVDDFGENTFTRTIKIIEEACDDDIDRYQSYARRIRKGQSKLRVNLLEIYEKKCCISGTGPENVLQAAHIDPHSETGSNVSTNALLLRSDLHDLFDDGLLVIEPNTLKVKVHPKLIGTLYYQFNDSKVADRLDGLLPNVEGLTKKWKKYYWGKTL